MNDLISRQALCEYALNQKDKSITPNDIMRFPSAQPEPCVDTIDALNESIKHFDDMAEECRRNANIERNDYMDMRDDAAEYRQLSIWLNELKWLRERFQSQPEPCEDCVSRKVIMRHYDSGEYKHVNHISRNGLLDYIEQLPSAQPQLPEWAQKVEEYRKIAPKTFSSPIAWALYQTWREYAERRTDDR